jgi:hypothetical protein
MKLRITFYISLFLTSAVLFISCQKKESTGIAPTYGTTGNPNPGNQTVTGSTTFSNPATENSSQPVGGPGWSNPTCGSTNSMTLKGFSDDTDVTLNFAAPIKTGTYAVGSAPSGTVVCALTLVNAAGQPKGIIWYGRSGSVVVNTTSTSISAAFTNIVCTQQTFNYPQVIVSGNLGCSP